MQNNTLQASNARHGDEKKSSEWKDTKRSPHTKRHSVERIVGSRGLLFSSLITSDVPPFFCQRLSCDTCSFPRSILTRGLFLLPKKKEKSLSIAAIKISIVHARISSEEVYKTDESHLLLPIRKRSSLPQSKSLFFVMVVKVRYRCCNPFDLNPDFPWDHESYKL